MEKPTTFTLTFNVEQCVKRNGSEAVFSRHMVADLIRGVADKVAAGEATGLYQNVTQACVEFPVGTWRLK
jgi:hypothetical protein